MAAPGGVIVLDDEEDGGPPPRPNGAPPAAPPAGPPASPPQPPAAAAAATGGHKAENERLFAEFVELCGRLTAEHPEVLPFLAGRRQKASAAFLASAELRNVLSRCLSRVRARRAKVYVYINELCTVLKAHTLRRKLPLAPAPPPETAAAKMAAAAPEMAAAAEDGARAEAAEATERPGGSGGGSKRQIRYLENLLRVYTGEIRRLQERELDLAELDSEDSPYLQESRLKRKMMRIFERLCQLKQCSSLTGRVIEQRIAYRGTRYPEVNRRIERFINRPEAFPDYADILKVIQKASARHSLGLARRQMESMAQDAFREVGNRLQERRHLDLVYNFGSHLTDQYRPGTDPALLDAALAKRLRRNRSVALSRLDAVISRYAQLQDESEEEERGRKRAARRRPPTASFSAESGAGKSRRDDDSDDDDSEDDDDDDDDSSDAELPPSRAEEEEEEEEEEEREEDGAGQTAAAQGDAERPRLAAEDARPPEEEEEEEEEARPKGAGGPSPAAELFVLEIEPLPLEAGETPAASPRPPDASPEAAPCSPEPSEAAAAAAAAASPPSPASPRFVTPAERRGDGAAGFRRPAAKRKRPPGARRPAENGAGGAISSTVDGAAGPKRRRAEPPAGSSPGGSEEEDEEEEEEEEGEAEGGPPGPLPDSTRADSPGHGLVSSSQGSPRRLPPKACKTSVATQCDPEEIIVLSDSD